MRSRFEQQLAELHESLIEMGAMIERGIAQATKALINKDIEAAKHVISSDDAVDSKEKDIESMCLKLLLSQQPVAKDLRQISTALKMITDMERIGDHAADISELCVYMAEDYDDFHLNEYIPEMARTTIKMVTDSIEAYVKKDLVLAESVIATDDIVDNLYLEVKKSLIELIHEDVKKGELAFDLLQIAKYYERIGDHAENIAEWVIFSITGMHKKEQVL
ncbi:MAG: phosphate signaling complex protein PhoU [Clostridiales bacterium]|nr:phosphate signaling complex protein PhoU [Clostridiales bacterium]HOA34586.1 phosphate signaling complex protein PhoU [Clostridiales bacterium]HOL79847.1 phosphate signaling complex protein PhoU [Clostridiales bacterium]HPP69078.1 phosphate signaling complex protein PhoU [Clostridiales bacterium]HPU66707.1 phosphate signaling complex protein PhoU [Clostridiales bacterium]